MRLLSKLTGLVAAAALIVPTGIELYRSLDAIRQSEARFQYDGHRYVLPSRAEGARPDVLSGETPGPYQDLDAARLAHSGLASGTEFSEIEPGSTVLLDTESGYVAVAVLTPPDRFVKVATSDGAVNLYRRASFRRMFTGWVAPPARGPLP